VEQPSQRVDHLPYRLEQGYSWWDGDYRARESVNRVPHGPGTEAVSSLLSFAKGDPVVGAIGP
jgi:hypothetical protein